MSIQICLSDSFLVNCYNSHGLIQPKNNTNIKVHLISKFQIHKKVSYNDKSEKKLTKNPDKSNLKKKRQCIQRESILKGKKLNMNWKTCRSAQLAKLIIQNIIGLRPSPHVLRLFKCV